MVRVLACGYVGPTWTWPRGDLPMWRQEVIPGPEVVGEVVTAAGA